MASWKYKRTLAVQLRLRWNAQLASAQINRMTIVVKAKAAPGGVHSMSVNIVAA